MDVVLGTYSGMRWGMRKVVRIFDIPAKNSGRTDVLNTNKLPPISGVSTDPLDCGTAQMNQ